MLILGPGIGTNTAIFSAINAVLFRHALLPEPDRLVDIFLAASTARAGRGTNHLGFELVAESAK